MIFLTERSNIDNIKKPEPGMVLRQAIRYAVIMLLAFAAPAGVSATTIYSYIDGRGVTHFTNVPADRRYQVYTRTKHIYRAEKRHTKILYQDHSRRRHSVSPSAFDDHIRRAAFAQELDPLLIKAIIQTESGFNQYAVSAQGALGLMQLMPQTAQNMRVRDPFDAAQNINAGTRYFKLLLDNYQGDLTRSLAAYNAGPSRISKYGPIPKIPETRAYVRKVIQRYRRYQLKTGASRAKNIKVRKLVTVD